MTRRIRTTIGALVVGTLASGTTIALVLAQAAPPPVSAQSTSLQEHVHAAPGQQTAMQVQEEQMMQMHQRMMTGMKAMDNHVKDLVTRMKDATGEAKVDAIAAAVVALVDQRMPMREGMMQMQNQMMNHMMRHMAEGGADAMSSMMESCPMMKMMGDGGK
jgi:uncharacterized protein (DUF3084 family)